MVCSRALGFVLLFLLPLALGIDENILKEIINKLHKTSGIKKNSQYAMAINVPARYCNKSAELDQNFLSQDSEQNVKNALNDTTALYEGTQLIAAKPKKMTRKKICHSEYRLLREPLPSPSRMENLLNKDKDGCTVFFTMNSPCVKFCSTPNTNDSIIPGLEIFKKHNGPKAFVFRQVWGNDTTGDNKVQLEKNIKTIDENINVYKCPEKAQCVRCVKNDNTVIPECTAKTDQNRF